MKILGWEINKRGEVESLHQQVAGLNEVLTNERAAYRATIGELHAQIGNLQRQFDWLARMCGRPQMYETFQPPLESDPPLPHPPSSDPRDLQRKLKDEFFKELEAQGLERG